MKGQAVTMQADVTDDTPVSNILLHLEYGDALACERAMFAAAGGHKKLTWMIWQTGHCIVVPQNHLTRPGFDSAASASAARGYPVYGRDTSGGALVQGAGVINLSMVFSIGPDIRDRIPISYRFLCEPIIALLRERGIEGTFDAVPGTMCDGKYNIVVADRKLAGTAQRWRSFGQALDEYAVLAHLALFVDLEHGAASEAVNAYYLDAGIENKILREKHINWSEIHKRTICQNISILSENINKHLMKANSIYGFANEYHASNDILNL